MIPYLYLISYIMYTSARVAKPGQRRQVQGLISQEFLGSNPIPRIGTFLMIFLILTHLIWLKIYTIFSGDLKTNTNAEKNSLVFYYKSVLINRVMMGRDSTE